MTRLTPGVRDWHSISWRLPCDKLTFLAGAAVGYILGARAGRARYEQIANLGAKVAATEPVQRAREAAMEQATELADKAKAAVGEKVAAAVAEGRHRVEEALGDRMPDGLRTTEPYDTGLGARSARHPGATQTERRPGADRRVDQTPRSRRRTATASCTACFTSGSLPSTRGSYTTTQSRSSVPGSLRAMIFAPRRPTIDTCSFTTMLDVTRSRTSSGSRPGSRSVTWYDLAGPSIASVTTSSLDSSWCQLAWSISCHPSTTPSGR